MSCELGATQTSLAAYYKFNQGVGSGTNTSVTTLTDASGNNNTGTLSSFALTGATSNFVTTGGVTTGTTCTAIASVAIAANPSGTIAVGTSVTFTATAINVGTPQYKWQKNGVDISGATASTYTSATLADADIITCQLTNSGLSCTATSNALTMTVSFPCPSATTLYVDSSKVTSGNGESWATAYKTLDEALYTAWQCPSVTQVNVAKGTYKPSRNNYIMGSDQKGVEVVSTDPLNAVFHLRQSLQVFGGYANGGGTRNTAANPTILEGALRPGDSVYHVVHIIGSTNWTGATTPTTLDGFTVQHGVAGGFNSSLLFDSQSGGAMNIYEAGSVLINNVIITDNTSHYYCSGVYARKSELTVTNSTFKNNTSVEYGGGSLQAESASTLVVDHNSFADNLSRSYSACLYVYYISSAQITNNTFTNNKAQDGSAIYIDEVSFLVKGNTFTSNVATKDGGAVYFTNGSRDTLSNNIFLNNTALTGSGGAVYANNKSLIDGNVFVGNSTVSDYRYGGGLYTNGRTKITNNLFMGNTAYQGGGLYLRFSDSLVYNNTFYANTASNNGGGLSGQSSSALVFNNLFWGNKKGTSTTDQGADVHNNGTSVTLSYNSLQLAASNYTTTGSGTYDIGTAAVSNLFATDPLFVNVANAIGADGIWATADDGLRLQNTSPAINAGTNTGVTATTDITGTARILNSTVDMGAYEVPMCDCDPTCSPIPAAAGTYTATRSVTSGGYTHYCSGNNLLLSINVQSGMTVPPAAVKMKIGVASTTFYPRWCGGVLAADKCFMTISTGNVLINRVWHIDAAMVTTTGLPISSTNPLQVKSYFTTTEFTALNTMLSNNGGSSLPDPTALKLYQPITNLGAFPDPNLIKPSTLSTIKYNNSTTLLGIGVWLHSTPNNGLNAAEYNLKSIINSVGIGKF